MELREQILKLIAKDQIHGEAKVCRHCEELTDHLFALIEKERGISKPQELLFPCKECGKLRTKDEGGTTFTICDECWDEQHKKDKPQEQNKIEELELGDYSMFDNDRVYLTKKGIAKLNEIIRRINKEGV